MTDPDCPPELVEFVTWLTGIMRTAGVSRMKLGIYLDRGGKGRRQIDVDLCLAYLPDWQYVVSTYLGPIQAISRRPIAATVTDEGKRLHRQAALVTEPYTPSDVREHESYSRTVAPVLAGFSLPAIVTLATATAPGQPYRDLALGLFIAATGLFLASFQLTISHIYIYFYNWTGIRSVLTFLGILLLVAALMVLVAAVSQHWWIDLALAALGIGGLTSALAVVWMRLRP